MEKMSPRSSARPKVFISYSHDSKEHKAKVKKLADFLNKNEIDTDIDQYYIFPEEGWPKWMYSKINDANFVLIICTKRYFNRFEGKTAEDDGIGVKFECYLTFNDWYYELRNKNKKYIPLFFKKEDGMFIPKLLKSYTPFQIDINQENLFEDQTFNLLLNFLKNPNQKIKPSPENPTLPNSILKVLVLPGFMDTKNQLFAENDIERYFEDSTIQFQWESPENVGELSKILLRQNPKIVQFNCCAKIQTDTKTPSVLDNRLDLSNESLHLLFGQEHSKNIKGVIVNGTYTEDQAIAITQNVPFIIHVPCRLEKEHTRNFLTNFYQNFAVMKNVDQSFAKSALNLYSQKGNDENLPSIGQVNDGKLIEYQTLEQIKRLEKELEILQKERESKTQQIKTKAGQEFSKREKLLEGNPYADLANWLSNNAESFLIGIEHEIIYDKSPKEFTWPQN